MVASREEKTPEVGDSTAPFKGNNKIQQSSKTMVASREEKTPEVDNSSQKSNIPESMEAFRTELLEHKAKEEAAEAEYNRLKDESNDAPDHYQRFSDADYKLTNIRNSRAGILFDEKYKDSLAFIDEHDTNIHSYDNFINDPDYLKKKGLDKKQTTSMSHGEHSPKKERTAEKLISDIKTNFGQETPAVTENTTRYAPQKDIPKPSPNEIKEQELARQQEQEAYNEKYLLSLTGGDSETTETTENVTTTNKHREVTTGGGVTTKTAPEYVKTDLDKAGEAHEQDPLNNPDPLASVHSKIKPQGYLEAKDSDLEKRRTEVEADMKANRITTDEANAKYDDINREQNNNEWDKMQKADAATASPKTATPYSDVPDSEKLDAPKFLLYKDSIGTMQKQDLETGEEFLATDEDIAQDKAQKELEAKWVEKHKTTAQIEPKADPLSYTVETPGENSKVTTTKGSSSKSPARFMNASETTTVTTTGGGSTLHVQEQSEEEKSKLLKEEAHQRELEKKYEGVYQTDSVKASKNPTASPLSKKEQDMLAEVNDLNAQGAKLKAERDAEPSYKDYGDDKESMDKDLNRLSENYTKQHELDDKRNAIIGTPEYLEARKKQKGQSGQSGQSQAPARQQQAQQAPAPAPAPAAGVGKSIPSVRNDDPTIKMMEEGSMWSTQGA
jgi:hypothetical protein